MPVKKAFTDRYLRSLPPSPKGERREVWDTRVPGFGIRIGDREHADPARRGKKGNITFILYARFQPGTSPARRTIGTYGAICLEEARRVAGQWRSHVEKGVDPAAVEAAAREAEALAATLRIKH
jgi:hypothetical protein